VDTVGVRELKARASEIVRRVRERGEEIDVTYRGRVVARLVPVRRAAPKRLAAVWADLDRLASEIGTRWPTRKGGAVRAVREGRRDL
jgi:prevent-host-death family protein